MKFLRERNDLSQSDMLLGIDRSQYSRIETGKAELTLKLLDKICTRFGITLNEYMSLDYSNSQIEDLVIEFRNCGRNLDDLDKKELFLDKITPLLNTEQKNLKRIEINFIYSVRSILSTYWKEIPELTLEEKQEIFDYLIHTKFYSQYDYMLALNTMKHYDSEQVISLVDRMYPLEMYKKRNDLTKQYSHLLLTNAVTALIYNQEYKLALNYLEKAQEQIKIKDSYYLHLNLLYLKNLTLYLITNQTKYIVKARDVIRIIHDIGDITTAKQLESELDTLCHFPNYYKETNQVVEMPAST